jgi:hypothetical protein
MNVAKGCGRAARQEAAMKSNAKSALTIQEFDPMMKKFYDEVVELVNEVATTMERTPEKVDACLKSIYCPSKPDEDYISAMSDPRVFVKGGGLSECCVARFGSSL